MTPPPPITKTKSGNNPSAVERPAHYRLLRGGVPVAAALLVIAFILALLSFNGESDKRAVWLAVGADTAQQANRLDIKATIQTIDPARGEVNMRLEFTPRGTLDLGDGWATQSDIIIYTSSSLKPEIAIKQGHRIPAQDITLPLYDGDYSIYPFDAYSADLWFVAVNEANAETLPLHVELAGQVFGYRVQAETDKDSNPEFVSLGLTLGRAALTRIWAIFVILLLWAMSLAVAGVAASMLLGRRKLEFAAFTWMGAMIFAFVGFRSAAPGAPPIGSLLDILAFFWAELIVAVSLVTVVLTYLLRKQKS